MARAEKSVEEYSLISIKIRDHRARVGASINHKANDKRYQHDGLRGYQFDSFLEITGICNYPDDRSGERYSITVYGNQSDEGDLNARLKEFHVKNKNGDTKYRKSRGHYLPVYEIPKGVGFLQKVRGDLHLMTRFGALGNVLRKLDIPTVPAILGILLGGNMEDALCRAIVISDGDGFYLFSSPIAIGLWAAGYHNFGLTDFPIADAQISELGVCCRPTQRTLDEIISTAENGTLLPFKLMGNIVLFSI